MQQTTQTKQENLGIKPAIPDQNHDSLYWPLLMLVIAGAVIALGRLLVTDEPLRWRTVIGRTILGSATSTIAGLVFWQIPDIHPVALCAIGCALGILGSTYIEELLKRNSKKWGL